MKLTGNLQAKKKKKKKIHLSKDLINDCHQNTNCALP